MDCQWFAGPAEARRALFAAARSWEYVNQRIVAAAVIYQDDFVRTLVAIQDPPKLSEHRDHVRLLVVEGDYDAVFYVSVGWCG